MKTAHDYWASAERCERLAEGCQDLTTRSDYVELARQWRYLAEQVGHIRDHKLKGLYSG
jgi:hypothetical protein